MAYVSYENIADTTIEGAQNTISSNTSGVPGISEEKVDANISITNIPLNKSIVGRNTTILFYAINYRKVSWTGGDINLPDGTTYSIVSGDTGDMLTGNSYYIYLDTDVSTTVLQKTTTGKDAVGANKLMLCVAQRNSDTSKDAIYQGFGGSGQGIMITADNIAANSITANEMNVNTLSAISADLGTITAGDITGASFKTAATGKRIEISSIGFGNEFAFFNSTGYAGSIEADDDERSIKITGDYGFIVAVPSTIQLNGTNVNLRSISGYITLDGQTRITDNVTVEGTQINFDGIGQLSSDGKLNITSGGYAMEIITSNSLDMVASIVDINASAVRITGHLRATESDTYNLGSSSYRWANTYTANLYTSNINAPTSVQSATTTSNRYVVIGINGTSYKLLLAT